MNTAKPVFERHRTLKELRAAVAAEGWKLNEELFNQGSDGVSFRFTVGRAQGLCVFNTANGTFVGQIDGDEAVFTSQSGEHDNCKWFQKLLRVCLVEKPLEKTAPAFGFDVEIEIADGPASSKTIWKHWRLKRPAQARGKGMLVSCAKRVLQVLPLTEKQWIAAYGDLRMKAES